MSRSRCILPLLTGLLLASCGTSGSPQTGGLTNWLRACRVDADCGDLRCLCGTCTRSCGASASCEELEHATCVPNDDVGTIALCGGQQSSAPGLCLTSCEPGECGPGTSCLAGVCAPVPEPTALVTIDTTTLHQTLVGFGACLTYREDDIIAFPRSAELYDAMFADSGLDMVRLRNRYRGDNPEDLPATTTILEAAADRLGHPPLSMLIEPSPPASLKANGSEQCAGNLETCTLVQRAGAFDYEGLAAHWRASLDAYATAGLTPDYLGIQNNPNWVPPESDPAEACRFLPTEGTTTELVDGASVELTYPGYAQALDAVVAALDGLASPPKIVAPEVTNYDLLAEYAAALDLSAVDALDHHLYGTDPSAIDVAALDELQQFAARADLPLFQTEMWSDGFDTAVLMHHALATEGASLYLQNDFIGVPASLGEENRALISLDTDSFALELPYHAMRHFALHTDPGWVRVDASSDAENLLVSAWLSPDEDALTAVLVNSGLDSVQVQLDLVASDLLENAEVSRTTFEGVERSAQLGRLSAERILQIPGRAIATVSSSR